MNDCTGFDLGTFYTDNKQSVLANGVIGTFNIPISDKEDLEVIRTLRSTYKAELTCDNVKIDTSLFKSLTTPATDKPKIRWFVPIMVQAKCHKKYRTNKKWLKRYGFKEDLLMVEAVLNSFNGMPEHLQPDGVSYYSSDILEYELDIGIPVYKYRPDQMYRNRKITFIGG